MSPVETTKQNIIKLLDEAQMYLTGHNRLSMEGKIKEAHRELSLLSKAFNLQEFKDAQEGLNKVLEARAETNRLLSELLSKHHAEEQEIIKALTTQ